MKCWGYNSNGALGLGDASISSRRYASSATAIPFNGKAIQISSKGYNFSCALLDNGELQCWGQNNYGQLGLGHTRTIGDDEAPTERTVIEGGGLNLIARLKTDHILHSTGQTVSFDGSDSYSSSSAGVSTYSWNFGDSSASQTGSTATHTFSTAGTYDVTLTVTDSGSQTHSVSKKLYIVAATTTTSSDESDDNTDESD